MSFTRFFLFIGLALFFAPRSDAKEDSHLVIGYTGSVYQDVVSTDIRAAVSVLIQKVVWRHFVKGETRYYETLPEMAADLRNRKIQVLATPAEEFMELRKRVPIDPILVAAASTGPETQLLLMVRKDSGIHSVRELRNRTIVIPQRSPRCSTLYQIGLENLLMGEGGGTIDDFFSSVREVRTAAKVVMPVFFRQADACVVSRQVLELMTELNPQIGRELMAIARVDGLSQGIIAVDRRLPEATREKIRQAFLTLHQTPEGEQLLMLFKVRKLVPFPDGYLKATESLYARHAKYESRRAH